MADLPKINITLLDNKKIDIHLNVNHDPIIVSFDVALITLTVCVMSVNSLGRVKIYHWDQIPLMKRAKYGTICKVDQCAKKALYRDSINNIFCESHRLCCNGISQPYHTATNISCTNSAFLLINTFDSYEYRDILLNGDIVLIETQPRKNQKMTKLSWFINMYFVDRSMVQGNGKIKKIDFFEPIKKTNHWKGSKSTKKYKNAYDQRKYNSVVICLKTLESGIVEDSSRWISFYNQFSKKDDYADSFNQALTYALSVHYKL